MTENLDFVAALVHGRRGHLAEGTRLQLLCRCKTVMALGKEVRGARQAATAEEFELQRVRELAEEIEELAPHLPGPVGELLHCLAGRFELEDLKLLVRRLLTQAPREVLKSRLVSSSRHGRLDVEALAKADSLREFVRLLPHGAMRGSLAKAVDYYHEQPRAFYFESALDQGYFEELLERTGALRGEDRDWIEPIVLQEVDLFHLMLVTRGRLIYGVEPEALRPFHLPGTKISRSLWEDLLEESTEGAIAGRVLGRVIDSLPSGQQSRDEAEDAPDFGLIERLAWTRFWRLADRAFRRSHMGPATVLAYAQLRRIEVANLLTVCEGVRNQIPAERIAIRLIPLSSREAFHV